MGVPKRKSSKSQLRMRKRAHRLPVTAVQVCPQCGAAQRPHRVCLACGYYRGRQVLTVKTD